MERKIALKKLGAQIGKGFGYRINQNAPTPEEREAARAALPAANERRDKLKDQMSARHEAILKADSEYQELRASWVAAREEAATLSTKLYRFRFTVGRSIMNGLCFSIMAEGDSWEEIFAKLEKKKAA